MTDAMETARKIVRSTELVLNRDKLASLIASALTAADAAGYERGEEIGFQRGLTQAGDIARAYANAIDPEEVDARADRPLVGEDLANAMKDAREDIGKRERPIRCDGCGRFVGSRSDARCEYTPLNEFGPEVMEWVCRRCDEKDKRT